MTSSPRQYFHGDQHATDAAAYYDAHADLFVPREELLASPGDGHARYARDARNWRRSSPSMKAGRVRPASADSTNLFA